MALPILKNEKKSLSLTKPISTVNVKLNWDANGTDLDLLAIGKKKGQNPTEDDVLFWGTATKNAQGKAYIGNQSVLFVTGDNRTGAGDDDEVMQINAMDSYYDEIEVYVYVYPPEGNGACTLDEAKNAKLEFFLNGSAEASHYFDFSDDKYFGVRGILAGTVSLEKQGYPSFEGKSTEFEAGLIGIFEHYNFQTE